MGIFATAPTYVVKGGRGLGFLRKLWIFMIIFFFFVLLLNSIVIGIRERDINPALSYLGGKFLAPTLKLGAASNQIIQNSGVVVEEESGFVKRSFDKTLVYTDIISSLIIIYLWIYVLSSLIAWSPFSNTSLWFINHSLAIIFFLFAQMLIMAIQGHSVMIPLNCFWSFFKALFYMVPAMSTVGDKLVKGVNFTKSIIPNATDITNVNFSNLSTNLTM